MGEGIEFGRPQACLCVFASRKDQGMRTRGMTSKSDVQGAGVGLASISPTRRAIMISQVHCFPSSCYSSTEIHIWRKDLQQNAGL